MATIQYEKTFDVPGTFEVNLPVRGVYKIECWGCKGGGRGTTNGGNGGYVSAEFTLTTLNLIYAVVGGVGTNGGGYAPHGHHGGGASDVRVGGNSLNHRIIVAGGGGSCGATSRPGGDGGYPNGVTRTENYGSGGAGGTQTSGGSLNGGFGVGGAGSYYASGYGGGGGGGWYGGGGVYPDYSADDDRGGGGGSSYILTETSYKPPGYIFSPELYASNPVYLNGVRTDVGMIKITLVKPYANFCHYSFTSDNKNFYIPTEDFYDKATKTFIPVDKTYLLEAERNKQRLVTDINKMFENFAPIGMPFYKYMKSQKMRLIKVYALVDEGNEFVHSDWFSSVSIRYRLTEEAIKDTKVYIKDYIECKNNVGTYSLVVDSNETRFLLESDNVFYDENLLVSKYKDVETKGFTKETILNKRIEFDKFKLLFQFKNIVDGDENKLRSINVKLNKGKTNRIFEVSEYDIITDSVLKKSYIRFNKDYPEASISKTHKEEHIRVNSLDKF